MEKEVLVTGASGNLGREVVKTLLARQYAVRAATRDTNKIASGEGVSPVVFDFAHPGTFASAMDGVNGLFLIAPPMDPEAPQKLAPVIDKARQLGVEHVVFNSALGVDQNEQAPLRMVERTLMDSGLNCTILRPNFFMENFSSGFIAPMIKHENGIFLAAYDGKTSFISTVDIAEVAATAFAENLYGKEYNLTGPEALDHAQVAQVIGQATGKQVAYHALEEEAMLQGARENGMPEAAVQYMRVLYEVVRAGYMAAVTDDVETVTGRRPLGFSEFVNRNVGCWQ